MSASKSQFSAAHLMYAVSLSGASAALFGILGLPIAAFLLLVWWQILSGAQRESQSLPALRHQPDRKAKFHVELAVVLFASAVVIGLLIPARVEIDPMQQSQTSLKMIAKAVAAYEQKFGSFPAVVTYDEQGQPLHSWRALILEQLGEPKLAAAYRLDEPWDGPNNSQLAKFLPWYYRRFYGSDEGTSQHTSVHLILGQQRPLIVEHEQLATPWLAPTETSLVEWNRLQQVPPTDLGFWHSGFLVSNYRGRLAVADQQCFTVHPGHALTVDELEAEGDRMIGEPISLYHVHNGIKLCAFLAIALYPLRWLKRLSKE